MNEETAEIPDPRAADAVAPDVADADVADETDTTTLGDIHEVVAAAEADAPAQEAESGESGASAEEAEPSDLDVLTEVVEVGTADHPELEPPRPPRLRRKVNKLVAALTIITLATSGTAVWLYFKSYLPGQQTDSEVAQAAITAASDGTVAMLSYSYTNLDRDFGNARKHLAGDFATYYDKVSRQTIGPAAKEKVMTATARVTQAAVSQLHPDSASVLVFVNQTTTTKDNPDPMIGASSALVGLTRIDGQWMITKFDPT